MRIAIYGGSFNPPHRGHVEAARSVQAALKPDKLLIIPTNIPPHKQMEADSPRPSERLAFCPSAAWPLRISRGRRSPIWRSDARGRATPTTR